MYKSLMVGRIKGCFTCNTSKLNFVSIEQKGLKNYGMERIPLAILMPVSYFSFQI